MKLTAILAATCLAFPANAGQLAFNGPAEPEVIVPEGAERLGGSGAWLLPLLAIALIAIAVNSSDDDPDEPDGCEQDCSPPPPDDDCISKACAMQETFGSRNWRDAPEYAYPAIREYYREHDRADGTDDQWGDWPDFWAGWPG